MKICPMCNRDYYNDEANYCFHCNVILKKISEDEKTYESTIWENQSRQKPPKEKLVVKCQYCSSENVKKISATSRLFSISFLGIGSNKIGKQWHCNNCGSNF